MRKRILGIRKEFLLGRDDAEPGGHLSRTPVTFDLALHRRAGFRIPLEVFGTVSRVQRARQYVLVNTDVGELDVFQWLVVVADQLRLQRETRFRVQPDAVSVTKAVVRQDCELCRLAAGDTLEILDQDIVLVAEVYVARR
jgi:hypothetical protein